jgi:hypothetical protein
VLWCARQLSVFGLADSKIARALKDASAKLPTNASSRDPIKRHFVALWPKEEAQRQFAFILVDCHSVHQVITANTILREQHILAKVDPNA